MWFGTYFFFALGQAIHCAWELQEAMTSMDPAGGQPSHGGEELVIASGSVALRGRNGAFTWVAFLVSRLAPWEPVTTGVSNSIVPPAGGTGVRIREPLVLFVVEAWLTKDVAGCGSWPARDPSSAESKVRCVGCCDLAMGALSHYESYGAAGEGFLPFARSSCRRTEPRTHNRLPWSRQRKV